MSIVNIKFSDHVGGQNEIGDHKLRLTFEKYGEIICSIEGGCAECKPLQDTWDADHWAGVRASSDFKIAEIPVRLTSEDGELWLDVVNPEQFSADSKS